MRELMPNIYVDNVELAVKEYPVVNILIVKDEKRSLLIDTGVTEHVSPKYRKELFRDLEELKIGFDSLDILITHSHMDHVGLVHELIDLGARVYMNPDEKEHNDQQIFFRVSDPEKRKKIFKTVGLDERKDPTVYEAMWGFADKLYGGLSYYLNFTSIPIKPEDHMRYGGYDFEVVLLKGHTYGMVGLYDERRNVIFCADHIMKNIVPAVGATSGTESYLADYLKTMEMVKHRFRGSLFIPCHGKEFDDSSQEADRIIFSYLDKCSLMVRILRSEKGLHTIRDIGTKVYGRDAHEPTLEQFTSCVLIWYKTYACLMYMKEQGLVEEEDIDGVPMWRAANIRDDTNK